MRAFNNNTDTYTQLHTCRTINFAVEKNKFKVVAMLEPGACVYQRTRAKDIHKARVRTTNFCFFFYYYYFIVHNGVSSVSDSVQRMQR